MRYIATGRVHPERADISFSRIQWTVGANDRVVTFCDSSQLTVVLHIAEITDVRSAFIAASHFAYMVVAALGFSLGCGYSVEIVQVTAEDGTPAVMGVKLGALEFAPHNPVFDGAVRLAAQDLFFRLALRDYSRAITDAEDCATYCYRAIESIKSAFAFRSGKDSWEPMHSALGTNKESIEGTVKVYADPIRHGNWAAAKSISDKERLAMLTLTRDTLKRYLDNAQKAL